MFLSPSFSALFVSIVAKHGRGLNVRLFVIYLICSVNEICFDQHFRMFVCVFAREFIRYIGPVSSTSQVTTYSTHMHVLMFFFEVLSCMPVSFSILGWNCGFKTGMEQPLGLLEWKVECGP